jgi:chromosome segregation ATPase
MAEKLDSPIDRLYAAPPAEFVERRDELAKSLRGEGEREAADEVKALRKPTVAAWAVNQLVRREKMRVRSLLTAGERLRGAHEQLLRGGPASAVQDAMDDERKATRALVEAAEAILEEAGQTGIRSTLVRVEETLRAAAADEELAARLQEGRLVKEEEAAGFGFASLPAGAAAPKGAKRGAAPTAKRRDAEAKLGEAEERLDEAREAAKEASRAVDGLRRELAKAERELGARNSAVESAERDVERRRKTLERQR